MNTNSDAIAALSAPAAADRNTHLQLNRATTIVPVAVAHLRFASRSMASRTALGSKPVGGGDHAGAIVGVGRRVGQVRRAALVLTLMTALSAAACSGNSRATATRTSVPVAQSDSSAGTATAAADAAALKAGEPTAVAAATRAAATIIAGGPTAIAHATSDAATQTAGTTPAPEPTRSLVATLVPDSPATATAVAATVVAGGPTAIAQATEVAALPATATPVPRLQLTLSGPTTVAAGKSIDLEVRVDGPATAVAAFNFDIVYDRSLVALDAPTPELTVLDTPDRQFQCNLPAPSGDIDPTAALGRARLVCFSYGGAQASAPNAPLVLARITLHGVAAGSATLTFENAAVFTPDAKNVTIATVPAQVTVN